MWGLPPEGFVNPVGAGIILDGITEASYDPAPWSGGGSQPGVASLVKPSAGDSDRARIGSDHRRTATHDRVPRSTRDEGRSAERRVSRRVRIGDRHRPGHNGACLAGRTSSNLGVLVDCLARNDSGGEARGGRRNVHSVVLFGPSPLAGHAMTPAENALVVMARHLSLGKQDAIARRRGIRLDHRRSHERQATETQAKPRQHTH